MTDDDPAITRVPDFDCPRCGYTCTAVGTTDGTAGAPTPGNVCGCMACGFPMMFDIDPLTGLLRLRTMTPADVDTLSEDQMRELTRVQHFAQTWTPMQRNRN